LKKLSESNKNLFQSMGFSTYEKYLEFKNLINQLKEFFHSLQKTNLSYALNMEIFSSKMKKFVVNIEKSLEDNRENEIQTLLDLKAQSLGGPITTGSLGEVVSNSITSDMRYFSKLDVMIICKDNDFLVEVMKQNENRTRFALDKLKKEEVTFLNAEKNSVESLDEAARSIKKKITKMKEEMTTVKAQIEQKIKDNDEIISQGKKSDEEPNDWEERKDKLNDMKYQLKEELSNLKDKFDESELKDELNQKENELKEVVKINNEKKNCLEKALVEVIAILEIWDRRELRRRNSFDCQKAILDFSQEIKRIQG